MPPVTKNREAHDFMAKSSTGRRLEARMMLSHDAIDAAAASVTLPAPADIREQSTGKAVRCTAASALDGYRKSVFTSSA
jgi:hypothetical protein